MWIHDYLARSNLLTIVHSRNCIPAVKIVFPRWKNSQLLGIVQFSRENSQRLRENSQRLRNAWKTRCSTSTVEVTWKPVGTVQYVQYIAIHISSVRVYCSRYKYVSEITTLFYIYIIYNILKTTTTYYKLQLKFQVPYKKYKTYTVAHHPEDLNRTRFKFTSFEVTENTRSVVCTEYSLWIIHFPVAPGRGTGG
jgi:hypothetical protein